MTSNISDLVKVKPLQWEYHPAGRIAACPSGVSYIIDSRGKRPIVIKGFVHPRDFDTVEDAQATAQKDYEARILSALTPADQPEQCFEVKEGYSASAFKNVTLEDGVGYCEEVPLSEALTIRSAEDVRREALEKVLEVAGNYVENGEYFGDVSDDTTNGIFRSGAQVVYDEIQSLIDTPAQSPDKAEPRSKTLSYKEWIEREQRAASPPDKPMSVAEVLSEIRDAVSNGDLSQGVRLTIIDEIALRALAAQGG